MGQPRPYRRRERPANRQICLIQKHRNCLPQVVFPGLKLPSKATTLRVSLGGYYLRLRKLSLVYDRHDLIPADHINIRNIMNHSTLTRYRERSDQPSFKKGHVISVRVDAEALDKLNHLRKVLATRIGVRETTMSTALAYCITTAKAD